MVQFRTVLHDSRNFQIFLVQNILYEFSFVKRNQRADFNELKHQTRETVSRKSVQDARLIDIFTNNSIRGATGVQTTVFAHEYRMNPINRLFE